ncbi:MAG: hypothetical protein MI923_02610 [Phycisphaerales bacterium]|nr:hypothetical protein [Phycisphaerales bacterium]
MIKRVYLLDMLGRDRCLASGAGLSTCETDLQCDALSRVWTRPTQPGFAALSRLW